ncbi:N-acetylglucosamine kinase [Solibacillus sp. R5-41]|uniref:BadF/BadG/BcrA/BcrD ATPase family protein n=1 Tax=Solibacillus sp. R5-41 TaxID=2048654 RepID=UPI000C126A70|nr:BadF/BadG/BcrA/BcrD ATPase family protein [Solibacillus sp. R5-41]ATP41894.1 N-acetylglucosamine kinase [Solibacillus sp. R5-41]
MNIRKQYLIGIDGGGTKTRCVIGDFEGNIIGSKVSTSGNINAIPLTELHDMLNNVIETILSQTKINLLDVQQIFICLAGADRVAEKEDIHQSFAGSALFDKMTIQSDAHAALAAGTWGSSGTLLIAGTGSIIFGRKGDYYFRVGGWGYLLGDEGSGFHLGKLAIRSILKSYDAKLPLRPFQQKILTQFQVQHPPDIISKIYSHKAPVPIIASICRDVLLAFEKGDELAKEIVQLIQEELIRLIQLAQYQMDMEKPLVLHGGLFSNTAFYEAFCKLLKQKFPMLKFTKPEVSGEVGAYILAMHANQIIIDEMMKESIKNSWDDVKEG